MKYKRLSNLFVFNFAEGQAKVKAFMGISIAVSQQNLQS